VSARGGAGCGIATRPGSFVAVLRPERLIVTLTCGRIMSGPQLTATSHSNLHSDDGAARVVRYYTILGLNASNVYERAV
jgi:hypothetical protein